MPTAPDYLLLNNTLLVAALLIAIGAMGIMHRRNRVTLVVSFGILLLAGLIVVTGFSAFHDDILGRTLWGFVLTAGVALTGVSAGIAYVAAKRDRHGAAVEADEPAGRAVESSMPPTPSGGGDE